MAGSEVGRVAYHRHTRRTAKTYRVAAHDLFPKTVPKYSIIIKISYRRILALRNLRRASPN